MYAPEGPDIYVWYRYVIKEKSNGIIYIYFVRDFSYSRYFIWMDWIQYRALYVCSFIIWKIKLKIWGNLSCSGISSELCLENHIEIVCFCVLLPLRNIVKNWNYCIMLFLTPFQILKNESTKWGLNCVPCLFRPKHMSKSRSFVSCVRYIGRRFSCSVFMINVLSLVHSLFRLCVWSIIFSRCELRMSPYLQGYGSGSRIRFSGSRFQIKPIFTKSIVAIFGLKIL